MNDCVWFTSQVQLNLHYFLETLETHRVNCHRLTGSFSILFARLVINQRELICIAQGLYSLANSPSHVDTVTYMEKQQYRKLTEKGSTVELHCGN